MSMFAYANAIKYALAYSDFKLDQDYKPKDNYASFVLTQNYWNIKARLTSKNLPTLDRINNRGHSADNVKPCCLFNPLVKEFMNQRIKAINEKTNGKQQFYKLAMNSCYGRDGTNQEKYAQAKLLSSDWTRLSHLQAFEMNKMHYVCGDTDSMTWAIS
ncbi:MAG: hypothetical protein EZS28_017387 [Streblomastix strix]|uniref:Uncharacterized protein n=1 Tax=Streblomastix strix TaxID=222440 RepID=A0A5J4VY21_9EUKA|nr:MAG: hypothetical protein EZS28_017387 [Streblomastix strix]